MEIKTDIDILEDDYRIPEEDFPMVCEGDFAYQIISRGKDYYNDGKVLKCIKSNNTYFAKVEGHNYEPYEVKIVQSFDGFIDYSCTCPYEFPCKHEYAVLLAISNKEYTISGLKPVVNEKKETIQEVIKRIPAEELKQYILSNQGMDEVHFHEKTFKNYFIVYFSKQDYDYYYNNLYNDLVLKNDVSFKVDSYLLRANKYIFKMEYEEAFKIVKSIVESYHDTDYLNNDEYIISKFPSLMLFLKAIYRGSNEQLKEEINNWKLEVESDNYYNNIFLNDILLSIN